MKKEREGRRRARPRFLSPEVLERVSRMTLGLLSDQGIEAAIAGGFAMQVYGSPRLTGDVDLLGAKVPTDPGPLSKMKRISFGGYRYVTQDGVEVDIIVRSDGFEPLYQEALERAIVTDDGLPVVSPDYMAAIKFSAGRPKDEDDLLWLLQQEGLVDRAKALKIVTRLVGGQFAHNSFKSWIDEADWRSQREKGESG